jgi:hypothetical protein
VFHGVRQRGGGLGSVLGGIAKYAFPLLRWLLPHAKHAALRTVSDVVGGRHSVKSALKENGIGFLKNVGSDIIGSAAGVSRQSGNGIRPKGKRTYTKKVNKKGRKKAQRPQKKSTRGTKRKASPTHKKNSSKRSKLDIFL